MRNHACMKRGVLSPEEQLDILAKIWGEAEGESAIGSVFLPWIPGDAATKQQRISGWHEHAAFTWPKDRDEILEHIKLHARDDLYFTPNVFLGDSRQKRFTGEEIVLWADLDEVNPSVDIDSALRPSIAWESSPGRFQAVWLLESMADGASDPGGLNHRLTAFLGADPSGWDCTQVLRIPGRRNFKFNYWEEDSHSVPGRLVWDKDTRFSLDFLESKLPPVKVYDGSYDVDDEDIAAVDRSAVYRRVAMKLSPNVRQYLEMKPHQFVEGEHDRSEVLWQIDRDLADAGCSVEEIVAIVRPTVWNKYTGRSNEMSQLKGEAFKAVQAVPDSEDMLVVEIEKPELSSVPTLLSLGQQSVPRPNWLIPRIWTQGSVGFIAGAPKSYKSYFALDMAISVATGTPFLGDAAQFGALHTPRDVIYIQEEDSLPLVLHRAEQIIEGKAPELSWKPRLTLAQGATRDDAEDVPALIWEPPSDALSRLHVVIRQGFMSSDAGWHGWLRDLVRDKNAALVIIDTLATTVGETDTNKSEQMNPRVFRPLKVISEETGCAIAIVNHNKKNGDAARAGANMLGTVAGHAWVESALYFHSKDRLPGAPYTEVKVERENKLAEDMRFRVRVPMMWEEHGEASGSGEHGDLSRQMWEPEVLLDWAESDEQAAAAREEVEDKPTRRVSKTVVVTKIQDRLGDGWWRFEEIAAHYGGNAAALTKALDTAVEKGQLKAMMEHGVPRWSLV